MSLMPDTRYVFLDANVYVQYLPYYKTEVLLKKLHTQNLVVCSELLAEIERVAVYDFIIQHIAETDRTNYYQYVQESLKQLEIFADIFINSPVPILTEQPAADPADWYITSICTQYNCTLVTADKHFLRWTDAPFPIVATADFFKRLGDGG
jgi:predicted nucleic acid-binding protein